MTSEISVEKFIEAIRKLPEDEPRRTSGKRYLTQKEHWLGWLSEYHGPGAYGRATGKTRSAKYVYNRIVEPKMLLYLIEAAGIDPHLVEAARDAAAGGKTMMAQSAAIRRDVPWGAISQALWG